MVAGKASIIIPDLFYNISDEVLDQESEFAPLNNIDIDDIYHILRVCLNYAKLKNKKIVFLAFGIGAALGLKLL